MADSLESFFYQLQGTGLYELLLPFLLVFTIVFAILEKTKIFGTTSQGESKSNINLIISLILGALIVNQFEIVERLNLFLPKISLFIVIALMFLVLVGLFGVNIEHGFSGLALGIATIVSLVVLWWALSPTIGMEFFVPYWVKDNWGSLLGLLILAIIIYSVTTSGKKDKTTLSNVNSFFDEMFKKR